MADSVSSVQQLGIETSQGIFLADVAGGQVSGDNDVQQPDVKRKRNNDDLEQKPSASSEDDLFANDEDSTTELSDILNTDRLVMFSSSSVSTTDKLLDLMGLEEHLVNASCVNGVHKGFLQSNASGSQVMERALFASRVNKDHAALIPEKLENRVTRVPIRLSTGVAKEANCGTVTNVRASSSAHPFLLSAEHWPVFHDFNKAKEVASEINTENTRELLERLKDFHPPPPDVKLNHPFIVVEGLDGTGKTTLTKLLADQMNAVHMVTPTSHVSDLRRKFDPLPERLRRSFYALSNYVAANEICEHTKKHPVVLDRFWHSTAAYAIGRDAGSLTSEHLPAQGSDVYEWPGDLIKPSAVVYLTISEQVRIDRMKERGLDCTVEEENMKRDRAFRERIACAYRLIGHDNWVEFDTNNTPEVSLQKLVRLLKTKQLI